MSLILCFICWGCAVHQTSVTSLPVLPDNEGFAGAFAGVDRGALIFAGGSNFPGKKPWEGGTKVWYDDVYVLEKPHASWKKVGRFPHAYGYGASVSTRDGLICIGGGNSERNVADVYRIQWRDSKLTIVRMASLPEALANCCAAIVGETLFVAGGQESPSETTASRSVYALDLHDPSAEWREVAPIPGPGRILATAATCDGAFWVVGGAELFASSDGKAQRTYLTDAYRYDRNRGWTRVADLPRPAVAAPSPAAVDAAGFCVLGGDDGSAVGFNPPEKHPGFSRDVYCFDVRSGKWKLAAPLASAHVTTPLINWRGAWVIPSGEIRPGKRTPEVLVYHLSPRGAR
jgi:N-acetylneuraminic acid mutarotase